MCVSVFGLHPRLASQSLHAQRPLRSPLHLTSPPPPAHHLAQQPDLRLAGRPTASPSMLRQPRFCTWPAHLASPTLAAHLRPTVASTHLIPAPSTPIPHLGPQPHTDAKLQTDTAILRVNFRPQYAKSKKSLSRVRLSGTLTAIDLLSATVYVAVGRGPTSSLLLEV